MMMIPCTRKIYLKEGYTFFPQQGYIITTSVEKVSRKKEQTKLLFETTNQQKKKKDKTK